MQLWIVIKQLLLVSHGQATVERSFSVNREIEVENMARSKFAAKRMVCDHIHSVGGINNIQVSNKQLLLYCVMVGTNIQLIWKTRKRTGQKRKALS